MCRSARPGPFRGFQCRTADRHAPRRRRAPSKDQSAAFQIASAGGALADAPPPPLLSPLLVTLGRVSMALAALATHAPRRRYTATNPVEGLQAITGPEFVSSDRRSATTVRAGQSVERRSLGAENCRSTRTRRCRSRSTRHRGRDLFGGLANPGRRGDPMDSLAASDEVCGDIAFPTRRSTTWWSSRNRLASQCQLLPDGVVPLPRRQRHERSSRGCWVRAVHGATARLARQRSRLAVHRDPKAARGAHSPPSRTRGAITRMGLLA